MKGTKLTIAFEHMQSHICASVLIEHHAYTLCHMSGSVHTFLHLQCWNCIIFLLVMSACSKAWLSCANVWLAKSFLLKTSSTMQKKKKSFCWFFLSLLISTYILQHQCLQLVARQHSNGHIRATKFDYSSVSWITQLHYPDSMAAYSVEKK